MKNPADMTKEELVEIVETIRGFLWADVDAEGIEVWNPNKEWDVGLPEDIAEILSLHGLRPTGKERY
jgi:hypothetical protein